MKLSNLFINSVWTGSTIKQAAQFAWNFHRARQIQEKILGELIEKNKHTEFGRAHSFSSIRNIRHYRKRVPVGSYEDFAPWIERICAGEDNVLTGEKVTVLEPTGGSGGGLKLIPYTRSLQAEFNRGLRPWLFDIYRHQPRMLGGCSYWSITPQAQQIQTTPGSIKVGFESDSRYLGWAGKFLEQTLAVPALVKRVTHMENFRYITAYFLLVRADLALLSVWSPTFLTLILDTLEKNIEGLLRDVCQGTLTPPREEDLSYLDNRIKPMPGRARALSKTLEPGGQDRYKGIWKQLALISCWAEGTATLYADKLREWFPGVAIQGKGLLATEGIVSLPLFRAGGNVPAYYSHLLEFLDEDGEARLIDELKAGATYQVLLSTGGGLYRYNLKDTIEVTGHYQGLPLIKLVGRDNVSDRVGEKLNEIHVQKVVESALQQSGVIAEFVLLAPREHNNHIHYTLYIQPNQGYSTSLLHTLLLLVEQGLRENYHYAYARDLGQLNPLELFEIKEGAAAAHLERCREDGQRPGDIKPAMLNSKTGWENFFYPVERVTCLR